MANGINNRALIEAVIKSLITDDGGEFTRNFSFPPFTTQLASNQGAGETLKFGDTSVTAGNLYYLDTSGGWTAARANNATTGAKELLAVALGTGTASAVGMLLKGFIRIDSTLVDGTPNEGLPVYVCDDTAGEFDMNPPAGSGEIVRIVGYCIDLDNTRTSDMLLYLDPDKSWVEIA